MTPTFVTVSRQVSSRSAWWLCAVGDNLFFFNFDFPPLGSDLTTGGLVHPNTQNGLLRVNAGINTGRDKEDKDEANQQERKDEAENQTNDTSEETVKKDNKNLLCDL